MQQIEAFFAAETPPIPEDPYRKYFCSELIVASLILVGYIGVGADMIHNPSYFAPGDLAGDPTFGFLVGYLGKSATVSVPGDDPLLGTVLVSKVPPWGL